MSANFNDTFPFLNFRGALYPSFVHCQCHCADLNLNSSTNQCHRQSTRPTHVESLLKLSANVIVKDSSVTQRVADVIPSELFIPLMCQALANHRDRVIHVLLLKWPFKTFNIQKLAPIVHNCICSAYTDSYLKEIVRRGVSYTTTVVFSVIDNLKKRAPMNLRYLDITGYPTVEVVLYYIALHSQVAFNEMKQKSMVGIYNQMVTMMNKTKDNEHHKEMTMNTVMPEETFVLKMDVFLQSSDKLDELCTALKVSSLDHGRFKIIVNKLEAWNLGEERLEILFSVLHPENLRGLSLKYNSIGVVDFTQLSTSLSKFTNLISLDLSCNGIAFSNDAVCVDKFSSMMKNCSCLKRLDLSGNRIKTKLCRILSDIPSGLSFLRLVGCTLYPSDVVYLSHSHHASTLQEIDLGDNNLSQSCEPVANILKTGKDTLVDVQLEMCCLSDDSLHILLPCLEQMTCLCGLNLAGNSLSNETIKSCVEVFSKCYTSHVIKIQMPLECLNITNEEERERIKDMYLRHYTILAELISRQERKNTYPQVVMSSSTEH